MIRRATWIICLAVAVSCSALSNCATYDDLEMASHRDKLNKATWQCMNLHKCQSLGDHLSGESQESRSSNWKEPVDRDAAFRAYAYGCSLGDGICCRRIVEQNLAHDAAETRRYRMMAAYYGGLERTEEEREAEDREVNARVGAHEEFLTAQRAREQAERQQMILDIAGAVTVGLSAASAGIAAAARGSSSAGQIALGQPLPLGQAPGDAEMAQMRKGIQATLAQHDQQMAQRKAAQSRAQPLLATAPAKGGNHGSVQSSQSAAMGVMDHRTHCQGPNAKTAANRHICIGKGEHCDGTTLPCCSDECSDNRGVPHNGVELHCDARRGNPSATGKCIESRNSSGRETGGSDGQEPGGTGGVGSNRAVCQGPNAKTAANRYICIGEGEHCDGTTLPCCSDECSDNRGVPHSGVELYCDARRGNPSATGKCRRSRSSRSSGTSGGEPDGGDISNRIGCLTAPVDSVDAQGHHANVGVLCQCTQLQHLSSITKGLNPSYAALFRKVDQCAPSDCCIRVADPTKNSNITCQCMDAAARAGTASVFGGTGTCASIAAASVGATIVSSCP